MSSSGSLQVEAARQAKLAALEKEAEALASRPRGDASGTSSGNSSAASKSADIRAIESKLETQLGIKTDIIWNEQRQNGRMTLTFSGLEQLEHVLEKLGST